MAISPYLVAHFAKSHLWHASMLLFGFFLTEACGLDARTMGFVMAGALACNGVIDAALGRHWSRRTIGAAEACRLQAWGAPMACLSFLLFCATPLFASDLRLGWALATLLLFRASYPFIDVPQNALVALIAPSVDAQCSLLTRRNIASGFAGLSVSAIGAALLIHGHGGILYLGWAALLSLSVCGTAYWLLRAEPPVATAPIAPDARQDILPPFVLVLGTMALMVFANATFRAMEPYYAAFAGKGIGLLMWAAIGGIVCQPLWSGCRRRFGMTGVLTCASGLLLLAAFTLASPLRTAPIGVAIAGTGFGSGAGGLWLILWSMMIAQAATGRATRYVGTFTGVSKAAQGAAMLLLGDVLSGSAYRVTLADPFSPPSLLMIGTTGIIAATCIALSAAIMIVGRTQRHPSPVNTDGPGGGTSAGEISRPVSGS